MNIEIEVNGRKIKSRKGDLILDALEANGIHVPTLCNLEGFKPSGACRICVVEVDGRHDLVPACSSPVDEWMKIQTHSARVIQARKTILELLLSSHSDGCLFCDRGRWCKLQELAAELNVTERKYTGKPDRRKIDNTSQAIIRDPSKCILCSRCVRVCEEVQVVAALDFLNRGNRTEVGTVLNKGLNYSSCIVCGQCIQVCPTGALRERSHIEPVAAMLGSDSVTAVAVVDPAVFVTLCEYFGFKPGREFSSVFINALRRMGFSKVYGLSWAYEYQASNLAARMVDGPGNREFPLLVSECPSFIRYLAQSRPSLLGNLTTLRQSRQLMARLTKELASKANGKPAGEVAVVHITPCTSVKEDTGLALRKKDDPFLPDFTLTTRETYRLIRLLGIQIENLSADSHEDLFSTVGRSGHLGAVSGGVIEMVTRNLKARIPDLEVSGEKPGKMRGSKDLKETVVTYGDRKLRMMAVSSITHFEHFLRERAKGRADADLLEVMACQYGCINGGGQPCTGEEKALRMRHKGIMEWDEKFSGVRTRESLELPEGISLAPDENSITYLPREIIR